MKCYEAAEWCEKEFEWEEWEMWMDNNWAQYTFEFKRPEAAAWFALRWAE
jgi:hypothetical protein